MEKLVKIAVILGALLASIGIFYHFVIFIPKELKQKEVKYELCKVAADAEYIANWTSACEMQASYNKNELKNCMSDPEILTNSLMGEKWCKKITRILIAPLNALYPRRKLKQLTPLGIKL